MSYRTVPDFLKSFPETNNVLRAKYLKKARIRVCLKDKKFLRKLPKRLNRFGFNTHQISTVIDAVSNEGRYVDLLRKVLKEKVDVYNTVIDAVVIPHNSAKMDLRITDSILNKKQHRVMLVRGWGSYTIGVSKVTKHKVEFIAGVAATAIGEFINDVVEMVAELDNLDSLIGIPKVAKDDTLTLLDGRVVRYVIRKLPKMSKASDFFPFANTYISLGVVDEDADVYYIELGDENNKLEGEEGWVGFGARTEFNIGEE